MEPDHGDAPHEAGKNGEYHSPACITITSFRIFLCDVDNISAKAILDGIVACGVLKDDGPRYVKEVSLKQEKVKNISEEKTVVEINWP